MQDHGMKDKREKILTSASQLAFICSNDIELHDGDVKAALACRIWEQCVWAAAETFGTEAVANGTDGVECIYDLSMNDRVRRVAIELVDALNLRHFFPEEV